DTARSKQVLAGHRPRHRRYVNPKLIGHLRHGQRTQRRWPLIKEVALGRHNHVDHPEQRLTPLAHRVRWSAASRAPPRTVWREGMSSVRPPCSRAITIKPAAAPSANKLDATTLDVNRREIRSPLDGVIEEVYPSEGEWLRPGQHIDLIGAYTPDMREADDSALQRSRIFVDSFETTLDHIGELKTPLETGVISRADVLADFYGLANGKAGRQSPDDITLFKNGGGAHLDLMTGREILRVWQQPISQ
ncbi:MAG: hypothetical protein ABFS30_17920, partial [Pseudomonadota bacterium]